MNSLRMLGTVAAARPMLAGCSTIVSLGALVLVGALTYLALLALFGRRTVERFLGMLRAARRCVPREPRALSKRGRGFIETEYR